ncbi:MAG TPA: class I SAM-dependent methyltransferase [Gaiellaceae bacterium]|nr:class I SAM-dependent methyltransferase [Gaiellaceae bacterium]
MSNTDAESGVPPAASGGGEGGLRPAEAAAGQGREPELPDYVRRNVASWTRANAEYTDASAQRAWAQDEIRWGVWERPESELNVLGDVDGLDIVELGCGTAYFSAWLARRGARVVGVDPTPAQLETARRLQRETQLEFPLIEATGEDVPLPDASFDIVHSEYGAAIWADPYRWVPEAARLLRPGGRLVFLRNSTLSVLCMGMEGVGEQLLRPQHGLHRIDWDDTGEVEFHLGHGDWIDLLRSNGFEVERLVELYARPAAQTHAYYKYVTAAWAQKWPAEEIWVARKASTRRRRRDADRALPGRPFTRQSRSASEPKQRNAGRKRG